LLHIVGIANLLQAIPNEIRKFVRTGMPNDALSFPLASDLKSLEYRRTAQALFQRAAAAASALKCNQPFLIASDLALWLQLRDPDTRAQGRALLEQSMREDGDGDRIFSLLSGLATVAAVTRSADLASEVRILTRAVRRRGQAKIPAHDAMRIGLIAAASHAGLVDWCKFFGEWVTEHSFEDLDRDTSEKLHSQILRLCHVEPRLWETCAKADAACSALNSSR
jgi:hypothetical protein